MFVGAALIAAMGALATVEGLRTKDELPSQLPADLPVTPGLVAGATIAAGVVYVVFAAGFITLGVLIRPGRNPARIVTWVVTGLFGLCCGCTDVLGAIGNAVPSDPQVGGLGNDLSADQPAWYTASTLAASIALVLVCLVVIVLLSLPVANDYFRREQETWIPPAWPTGPGGYAYPGTAYPPPPVIPQYPYLAPPPAAPPSAESPPGAQPPPGPLPPQATPPPQGTQPPPWSPPPPPPNPAEPPDPADR